MSLYLITHPDKEAESGKRERLVEANNVHAARNHVARDVIKGEIAKPMDLFRLAKDGVNVEVAGVGEGGAAGAPASNEGGEGGGSGAGASGELKPDGEGGGAGEREPNDPPNDPPKAEEPKTGEAPKPRK